MAQNYAPLIVTLHLDRQSFARFNSERERHFPPSRNLVPAHLTMFHHLPGWQYQEIADALASLAAKTGLLKLLVPSLRFMGNGLAYDVVSRELIELRETMARRWASHLTPQDAQAFRPHVTIQNKVPAEAAKALYQRLSETFEAFHVAGIGLQLWRYRGGPWEAAGEFAFEG
jgi:2'-5' RNA ligase